MKERAFPQLRRYWTAAAGTLCLVIIGSQAAAVQSQQIYLPFVTYDPDSRQAAARPSWGSTIAVSPDGTAVWVVNPDAGSVSVVDTHLLQLRTTVDVGKEPWSLAIAGDGAKAYVVDRAAGTVAVLDARSYALEAIIPVGPEPGQIALSPSGNLAYVTSTTAHQLVVVDTLRRTVMGRIPMAPRPYAIVVTDDGDADDTDERLLVTHLQALPATQDGTALVGQISILDAGTLQQLAPIRLQADAHGFPNRLTAVAVAGPRGWVPMVRAAPEAPNGVTTTIFPAVATINLATGSEEPAAALPLNDQDIFGSPINNPHALVPTADGRRLYIVLAGSNQIEVVDVAQPDAPQLVKFLPTGLNPRGLALSPDEQTGYVMNFLSRSITVFDLQTLQVEDEITVVDETLEAQILHGKRLFNEATDPKLSHGSWFSCASCHLDGGADGITWLTPDGPRQTPALWSAGSSGPWHWSATFDELQDVEQTIQRLQHGLGLAPGTEAELLATPTAGRSADLDALAAYLARGIRPPALPEADNLAAVQQVGRGRQLFQRRGCPDCHGGPAWTASMLPGAPGGLDVDGNHQVDASLRKVGTLHPQDVRGAEGFDPPSLLGVGLTEPYFHDGSMATLEALLVTGHPTPEESSDLAPGEIRDLAAFVRAIGPETAPFEEPARRVTAIWQTAINSKFDESKYGPSRR